MTMHQSAGGGGYDVTAEWRIDLEGTSTAQIDLSTGVGFYRNGVSLDSNAESVQIVWDVAAGGVHDCGNRPDGDVCGTATIGTTTIPLTCDSAAAACSTPPFVSMYPAVTLAQGNILQLSLSPASGAQSETQTSDDTGSLTFGSWNRKIVDVSVTPAASGAPGKFDVTATIQLELDAGSTLPLDLSVDTEPVNADPCCQEACCCPACSSDCGGNGCGGGGSSTVRATVEWIPLASSTTKSSSSGIPVVPFICTDLSCTAHCGTGQTDTSTFDMNCDPGTCTCRSDQFTLVWPDMAFSPGDEIMVILRPAPGALPELPGLDDLVIAGVPEAVPALSGLGVALLGLLLVGAGSVLSMRRASPTTGI